MLLYAMVNFITKLQVVLVPGSLPFLRLRTLFVDALMYNCFGSKNIFAALQAIPSGDDGVPDSDTRAALLRTLTSLPDVAAGKGLQLGVLAQFREALTDFARVCRRMLRADDFYVEAYDWVKA